ncbi:MAG: hypothetical protein JWN84_189 [Nocardioides sp.]|nr:hypothetical protein [Nocardioides sp.]
MKPVRATVLDMAVVMLVGLVGLVAFVVAVIAATQVDVATAGAAAGVAGGCLVVLRVLWHRPSHGVVQAAALAGCAFVLFAAPAYGLWPFGVLAAGLLVAVVLRHREALRLALGG